MQLRIAKNIEELNPDYWDRHHDGSFYFKHSFLKVLSESEVEDADYRYLSFSIQGRPAGVAVLSKFNLHLDLLSGEPLPVRLIKKLRPQFFQLPVIFAGLPASFGQPPFFAFENSHLEEITNLTHNVLTSWAEEEKVKLQIWKELPEGMLQNQFRDLDYLRFSSIPDMQLPLNWTGIGDYLAQMRSAYRRKVKTNLADWKHQRGYSLRRFRPEDVSEFYHGYARVMQRTSTRLEMYPEEFFRHLALSDNAVDILSATGGGQKISALLVEESDVLNFILVSKPLETYPHGLYNKLLHGAAFAGIEKRKKLLRYGQTSVYSKSSVGCAPVNLKIYLRHHNSAVHFLLAGLGRHLFPETKCTTLKVFRTTRAANTKHTRIKVPA